MVKTFLQKKYPFPEMMSSKLLLSFTAASVVMIILTGLRPFGITSVSSLLELYMLGFGIITFLMVYLSYAVIPLMFPNYFDAQRWSVLKQLFHMTGMVTAIVVSNWVYSTVWMGENEEFPSLARFMIITLMLSIPTGMVEIMLTLYLTKKRGVKQKA